jgi:hypothetical protein
MPSRPLRVKVARTYTVAVGPQLLRFADAPPMLGLLKSPSKQA